MARERLLGAVEGRGGRFSSQLDWQRHWPPVLPGTRGGYYYCLFQLLVLAHPLACGSLSPASDVVAKPLPHPPLTPPLSPSVFLTQLGTALLS